MLSIRQSNATAASDSLQETKPRKNESNRAWLQRVGAKDGVLPLGGASVAHFRIRVAQSHARADLKPSCWSLVGILTDSKTFLSVPLELCGEASDIATHNGVQSCNIADYDDPLRFPNIAVIRFTKDADLIL